jgi:hypothetical protein
VGSFTIDGSSRPPATDRYEIAKVHKIRGDQWEIAARIVYGTWDLTVPVPVQVVWAGDTATIQLTDLAIPGMPGKFRTRLLIDGTHYAGTWAHDHVGGHMWGRIERAGAAGNKGPQGKTAAPKADPKAPAASDTGAKGRAKDGAAK